MFCPATASFIDPTTLRIRRKPAAADLRKAVNEIATRRCLRSRHRERPSVGCAANLRFALVLNILPHIQTNQEHVMMSKLGRNWNAGMSKKKRDPALVHPRVPPDRTKPGLTSISPR